LEFSPALRVVPFHPDDAASKLLTEVRVLIAILRRSAVANAVRKNRLETVVLAPIDVRLFVDHQPHGALANAAAHDPRGMCQPGVRVAGEGEGVYAMVFALNQLSNRAWAVEQVWSTSGMSD
jgi:hypothetical protein